MRNEFAGQNAPAANGYATAMDEPADYPKCKHHPVFGPRLVHTAEQEAVIGEGWFDSPADFPPVPETPQGAVEGCPGCEALTAKFSELWMEISEEKQRLLSENAELRAKVEKKANKAEKADKTEK
jgi:hypothetical protein